MKKFTLLIFLLPTSAFAQTVNGPSPLGPSQHNLAITSATSLTIPPGANYASICTKGGAANFEIDGQTTPTGSIGMPLAQGSCVPIQGSKSIQQFQAIQQTGNTTTLDVLYSKW